MSFGVSVKGGTGAGSRRVKKLKDWTCKSCGRWHPGKDYSCGGGCEGRRPD